MKKLYVGIIVLILGTLVFAAEVKWSAITVQNDADTDDRILIVDDPNGTPANYAVPRNYFLLDWPGSVNLTTFAPDGVDSDDIANGAIDQLHFAVDVIGADEYADGDLGDTSFSGGASTVEAMTLGDASTGTYYVGLFADDTGVNRPIYADAPLSYVQATGTLAATEFSGGGGSLTGIDAATGDSATAFFDAGTIEHEWGGLQADISGYTGLIAITGADTTAEIDSLDELEGQLADVTRIVSEAVMPVASTDPDVDAQGEISVDTDGANEPNDVTLRVTDTGGDTQYALAQVLKSIQGTVITPNDLADATRDACPVWENNTGMIFTITMIRMWSDTDDTTVNVETYDSDWDNNATVDAIEIATDEVANFSVEETTITAATIAAGSLIVLDFDDTDDPGWVKFNIMGYFNADVD